MTTAQAAQLVTAEVRQLLAAAVAEFEAGLTIGPDGCSTLAVTGETFAVCCTTPCATAQEAIDQWAKAATALFPITPMSILYWRIRPEIDYQRKLGWRIYSRFLISAILTQAMHDAVMASGVGQFLDRLVREEFARGANTSYPNQRGNVVQDLWAAFMAGRAPASLTPKEN